MAPNKDLKQLLKSSFPVLANLKSFFIRNRKIWRNYDIYRRVLSYEHSNDLLANLIQDRQPVMITRFGWTEADCVLEYLNGAYKSDTLDLMSNNSGFFPQDHQYLDQFSQLFLEASKAIDVLAVWFLTGEPKIIRTACPTSALIELRSLEPYYHANPWSKNLEGKKVLVIHPFAATISSQYHNRRELIFKNKDILPEFQLTTIKAVQSLAGNQTEFNTWFDAYDWMCNQIRKQDFDVAIIGCGAYGLPLAAYVKSLGKQAVHLGGATQILFGIKGNRWDQRPFFQSLYNEYWVKCNPEDIPASPSKYQAYW